MSRPTDVEVSRALNALAVTLNDQRPRALDPRRAQAIVDGALAGEHKLEVIGEGERAARVVTVDDQRLVATAELAADGAWIVERRVSATGSDWALPQR
jgi:hypothetical protein